MAGATWFYWALNPALFVVGLLAVVGVVVAVSLKGSPWLIVLIVALIVLFAFAEGTYRE